MQVRYGQIFHKLVCVFKGFVGLSGKPHDHIKADTGMGKDPMNFLDDFRKLLN